MNLNSARMGMVALVMFGLGCEEETPQEKCEAFYELVCDKLIECSSSSLPANYRQACLDALEGERSCSRAVSVDDSYDDCIDDFTSAECSTLFPLHPVTNMRTTVLPSACMGVIKVQ